MVYELNFGHEEACRIWVITSFTSMSYEICTLTKSKPYSYLIILYFKFSSCSTWILLTQEVKTAVTTVSTKSNKWTVVIKAPTPQEYGWAASHFITASRFSPVVGHWLGWIQLSIGRPQLGKEVWVITLKSFLIGELKSYTCGSLKNGWQ